MDKSTKRFLELLEKQNAAIAAREATKTQPTVGEDPVRLQREAEQREKWGQLRARASSSTRMTRARSISGSINTDDSS